jgi:hypothetical protein
VQQRKKHNHRYRDTPWRMEFGAQREKEAKASSGPAEVEEETLQEHRDTKQPVDSGATHGVKAPSVPEEAEETPKPSTTRGAKASSVPEAPKPKATRRAKADSGPEGAEKSPKLRTAHGTKASTGPKEVENAPKPRETRGAKASTGPKVAEDVQKPRAKAKGNTKPTKETEDMRKPCRVKASSSSGRSKRNTSAVLASESPYKDTKSKRKATETKNEGNQKRRKQ